MRILGRIRSYRHGDTLIFIPEEIKEEFLSADYVKLKYRFIDGEPRRRFRTLTVNSK